MIVPRHGPLIFLMDRRFCFIGASSRCKLSEKWQALRNWILADARLVIQAGTVQSLMLEGYTRTCTSRLATRQDGQT